MIHLYEGITYKLDISESFLETYYFLVMPKNFEYSNLFYSFTKLVNGKLVLKYMIQRKCSMPEVDRESFISKKLFPFII